MILYTSGSNLIYIKLLYNDLNVMYFVYIMAQMFVPILFHNTCEVSAGTNFPKLPIVN